MFAVVKFLLLVAVLAAGAVLGIGFTQDPQLDVRTTVLIDAPVDDVWDVVSDPRRTPEWLPQDLGPIERTEVHAKGIVEKAAGVAIDAVLGGGTKAGTESPTHTYVGPKGSIDMQISTREKVGRKYRYMERVVRDTMGFDRFFASMAWGFELKPDGDKTKLTVIQSGVAKKPHGTFLKAVLGWLGKTERNATRIARNVEAVAKGRKKKE